MWRHIAANFITILIVLLVALAGLIGWGQSQYTAVGPGGEPICVEVRPNMRMGRLGDELAERGAVTNARIFRLGAEYSGKSDDLKAGSFLVPAGASMSEIVDIVTRGGRSTCGTEVIYRIGVTSQEVQVRELDPATNRFVEILEFDPAEGPAEGYADVRDRTDTRYRIALAEGATSWQIVEALKQADFLEGDVADVPPEGTLAPDSYEVVAGTARADVIAEMVERQNVRLAEAWANRAVDLPVDTPEELLILASLVEKEAGNAEEQGTIASVFVNRLNRGMRLQTDPTVIYGVTEGRGTLGRGIRLSELRAETPWNTYVIDGLPPTPIANPGASSLAAAANPPESEYYYFVAKTLSPADGHNFSRTLEEHNRFVEAYRALEAESEEQ